MKKDDRFIDTDYVDWTSLVGHKIIAVDMSASNCIGLKTQDTSGKQHEIVVDTDAIGFGLVTPVLVPAAQYQANT